MTMTPRQEVEAQPLTIFYRFDAGCLVRGQIKRALLDLCYSVGAEDVRVTEVKRLLGSTYLMHIDCTVGQGAIIDEGATAIMARYGRPS